MSRGLTLPGPRTPGSWSGEMAGLRGTEARHKALTCLSVSGAPGAGLTPHPCLDPKPLGLPPRKGLYQGVRCWDFFSETRRRSTLIE